MRLKAAPGWRKVQEQKSRLFLNTFSRGLHTIPFDFVRASGTLELNRLVRWDDVPAEEASPQVQTVGLV